MKHGKSDSDSSCGGSSQDPHYHLPALSKWQAILFTDRLSSQLMLTIKSAIMTDWAKDEFMSQWDQKYVSTNLKSGARAYDKDFFLSVNSDLATQPELHPYSYALVVCPVTYSDPSWH